MGAQFTNQEINASIAQLMREDFLSPAPDYINSPADEARFLAVAEPAVKASGAKAWETHSMLQAGGSSKVVAMVAFLRLMDGGRSVQSELARRYIYVTDILAEDCPQLAGFTDLRVVWSGDTNGASEWMRNTPVNRQKLVSIFESVLIEADVLHKKVNPEIVGR